MQSLFSFIQLFWNVSALILLCLHSVSDCFCTFCKFQPKPLPFTAYQECKPVQSSTRQLRKQHAYLPPCSDIIYSAVSLLWAHNKCWSYPTANDIARYKMNKFWAIAMKYLAVSLLWAHNKRWSYPTANDIARYKMNKFWAIAMKYLSKLCPFFDSTIKTIEKPCQHDTLITA